MRWRGDYLLVLQKPPISARTWRDHGVPNRWPEKVDRKFHAHIKPIGLIRRLIAALTEPGDLVIDPAAGSFTVMVAARQLGRDFVGCDIAFDCDHSAGIAQLDLILAPPPTNGTTPSATDDGEPSTAPTPEQEESPPEDDSMRSAL